MDAVSEEVSDSGVTKRTSQRLRMKQQPTESAPQKSQVNSKRALGESLGFFNPQNRQETDEHEETSDDDSREVKGEIKTKKQPTKMKRKAIGDKAPSKKVSSESTGRLPKKQKSTNSTTESANIVQDVASSDGKSNDKKLPKVAKTTKTVAKTKAAAEKKSDSKTSKVLKQKEAEKKSKEKKPASSKTAAASKLTKKPKTKSVATVNKKKTLTKKIK